MKLSALLFVVLTVVSSRVSAGSSYDNINCTAIVGGNTVKLDSNLVDFKGRHVCAYTDSSARFVGVKKGGLYNIYDMRAGRFTIKKWSSDELFIESYGEYLISARTSRRDFLVADINSGAQVARGRNSYDILSAKDFGGKDFVVQTKINGDGPCDVSTYGDDGRLLHVLKTSFGNCGYSGRARPPFVGFIDEKNGTSSEFDLSRNGTFQRQYVDQSVKSAATKANCGHLYVGRVFSGSGGLSKFPENTLLLGLVLARKGRPLRLLMGRITKRLIASISLTDS